jgi:phenylalanyl-tRNA synthetase beta chain
LHECDLAEDLALAYGYNAIQPSFPQSATVAEPFPLNKLSDQLRTQMAMCGWTEVLFINNIIRVNISLFCCKGAEFRTLLHRRCWQ